MMASAINRRIFSKIRRQEEKKCFAKHSAAKKGRKKEPACFLGLVAGGGRIEIPSGFKWKRIEKKGRTPEQNLEKRDHDHFFESRRSLRGGKKKGEVHGPMIQLAKKKKNVRRGFKSREGKRTVFQQKGK